MRRLIAACTLSLTAALAACGSGDAGEEVASATTLAPYTPGPVVRDAVEANNAERAAASTAAASASASAAAASRSTAAAAAAVQAPGATVSDGKGHTATYYSIQRPAATNAPDPQEANSEWAAIDVQVCYGPGAMHFDNNYSWRLIDANNGTYEPSSTGYSQFPAPKFPFGDMTVVDGQCIRGWIVYPVVIGAPIVKVAYMPYGASKPLTWTP